VLCTLDLEGGFSEMLPAPINHTMNIDCDTLYLSKSFMCIITKKKAVTVSAAGFGREKSFQENKSVDMF
jgi:hypothetical protein